MGPSVSPPASGVLAPDAQTPALEQWLPEARDHQAERKPARKVLTHAQAVSPPLYSESRSLPQHSSTLVLLAHPSLATSRVNTALAASAQRLAHVTVHDLAQARTATGFDVAAEQRLLLEHHTIVMQFPWYWYSMPWLLKEWTEQVLTYGFAYGEEGSSLLGKPLQLVITTGAPRASYQEDGHNRFTMKELMRPLEATAHLCGMTLEEPFIVHGVRTLNDDALASRADAYRVLLSPALV